MGEVIVAWCEATYMPRLPPVTIAVRAKLLGE